MSLTATHLDLQARAREKYAVMEPTEPVDDARLAAQVAALGDYRYLVPASYGGAHERVDVRSICVLREELAYRNAAADSVFAVQGLGSHPVVLAGSETQRRELLTRVAEGSALF